MAGTKYVKGKDGKLRGSVSTAGASAPTVGPDIPRTAAPEVGAPSVPVSAKPYLDLYAKFRDFMARRYGA